VIFFNDSFSTDAKNDRVESSSRVTLRCKMKEWKPKTRCSRRGNYARGWLREMLKIRDCAFSVRQTGMQKSRLFAAMSVLATNRSASRAEWRMAEKITSGTAVFMVPLRFASRAHGNPHGRKRIMPFRKIKMEREGDDILPLEIEL